MSTTGRILDLIDAGVQSSAEGGMSVGDPDSCARCLMCPRSGQSEFCSGCRAWLLGDAAADEPVGQRTVTLPVPRAVRSRMEEFIDRMTDALLAGASWPMRDGSGNILGFRGETTDLDVRGHWVQDQDGRVREIRPSPRRFI